jgi:hypothetical protein
MTFTNHHIICKIYPKIIFETKFASVYSFTFKTCSYNVWVGDAMYLPITLTGPFIAKCLEQFWGQITRT